MLDLSMKRWSQLPKSLILLSFFFVFLVEKSEAYIPLNKLTKLSAPFVDNDSCENSDLDEKSPMHGLRALKGGLLHYYYYYISLKSADADKAHHLAKALFHKSTSGLEPTVMGSNIASHMSSRLIGKIVREYFDSRGLDEGERAKKFYELITLDHDFKESVLEYAQIKAGLEEESERACDSESKAALLNEAHKYKAHKKELNKNARRLAKFLTGSKSVILLQGFMMTVAKCVDDLLPYYQELGINFEESNVKENFQLIDQNYAEQSLDEQTYSTLKTLSQSIELIPYGTAVIGNISFSDCGETVLRNILRIIFMNSDHYDTSKYLDRFAIPEEVVNFFFDYPTEENQLSAEARNVWASIISRLNHMSGSTKDEGHLDLKYNVNTKDLAYNLSSAGNPSENLKNALYRLLGVSSLEDLSQLLARVSADKIEFHENLNGYGVGSITMNSKRHGEFLIFLHDGHFSMQGQVDAEALDLLEVQSAFALKTNDMMLFSMFPNSEKKLQNIRDLLDQTGNDQVLSLLAPIINDDEAINVISFLSKGITWPANFAEKLFHRLSSWDAKARFVSVIKPIQRLSLAKYFITTNNKGRHGLEEGFNEIYESRRSFFDAFFICADFMSLKSLLSKKAGVSYGNSDEELFCELATYPNLKSYGVKTLSNYINKIKFRTSKIRSNGIPRAKDDIFYAFLIGKRLNENGFENVCCIDDDNNEIIKNFNELLKFKISKMSKEAIASYARTAARAGNIEIFDYVVSLGANPSYGGLSNHSPLYWAIEEDEDEMLAHLLMIRGIDINSVKGSFDKESALLYALNLGKIKQALMILSAFQGKININLKNTNRKENALHHAAWLKSKSLVEHILTFKKLEINELNYFGESALHIAVSQNDAVTVELLSQDYRIDLNVLNSSGLTPLGMARARGFDRIIKILEKVKGIEFHTSYFKKRKQLKNLLFHASEIGDLSLLNRSLVAGYSPNSKNCEGNTPLHIAVINFRQDLVLRLLEVKNIDVNIRNNNEFTPLYLAIEHENIEAVKALIQHPGVDLNLKFRVWSSVLGFAAKLGKIEIVKLLINNPIHEKIKPLSIKNKKNIVTEAFIAAYYIGSEMLNLVLQVPGTDLSFKSDGESDVFQRIMRECDREDKAEIIKILLKHDETIKLYDGIVTDAYKNQFCKEEELYSLMSVLLKDPRILLKRSELEKAVRRIKFKSVRDLIENILNEKA